MTTIAAPQQNIDFNLGSFDLCSYEALTRLLDNLKKLENSVGFVNNKFKSELDKQKQKLQQIVDRLIVCRKKIEVLEKLNIAITFISPARFVKKYKYQDELQSQIFYDERIQQNSNIPERRGPAQMYHQPDTLGKPPEAQMSFLMKPDELKNTLSINFSRFRPRRKHLFEGEQALTKKADVGLGQIPSNLQYADCLLIYNTMTNPYTHYSKIDPLATPAPSLKKQKQEEKKDPNKLAQAPQSIMAGSKMEKYQSSGYDYKPTSKQGPVLQFEENLEFDNIVDLQVGTDNAQSFAPSQAGVMKQNKIIEDPYKNQPMRQPKPSQPQQQQPSVSQQPVQQTTQQPQMTQQPQPVQQQLTPQQLFLLQAQQGIVGAQSQMPAQTQNIPTVQPQTTLQAPVINIVQEQTQQAPQQPVPSSGGNARSALLDSIRKFKETSKLKAIKTKERGQKIGRDKDAVDPEELPESKKLSSKKPMSMMDQLKQKINNRFQALNPPQVEAKVAKNATVVKKNNQQSSGEEEEADDNQDD